MALPKPPSAYAQGFHTKSFQWKGIYILGNNDVPDEAVMRAAEIVFNSMSTVNSGVFTQLAKYDVRFAVIPYGTKITDLPDYDDLRPVSQWQNFRGLGAVIGRPTSSAGEENIMPGDPNDPYYHSESIALHEWLHAIEGVGLAKWNPTLHAKFKAAYKHSVTEKGLWANTYAGSNFYEYFAETGQTFFNGTPDRGEPGDGIHNSINTRAELATYDPEVYALFVQLFGNPDWTVGEFYGSESADELLGRTGGELILGNGGDDFLSGDSGADYLMGGADNDTLIGGSGKDQMDGGDGNDTADYADSVKKVELKFNGGSNITVKVNGVAEDTIRNIENALGGSGNDKLTGDSNANYFYGGEGKDTLNGGKGNDRLEGADGADRFVFNTTLNAATNVDTIVDFTPGSDKIQLDDLIFKAIGIKLDAKEFYAAPSAIAGADKSDRIVYDTLTGELRFDIDGNKAGGKAAILFAILNDGINPPPTITTADFSMI